MQAINDAPSGRGRAIGVAGILFAVLETVSILLLAAQPPPDANDAAMAAWFADAGNRLSIIAGLYLAPLAAIFFLWFLAAIRARISGPKNQLVATVFLGSGLLFIGCLLAAAAAWGGIAAAVEYLDIGSEFDASSVLFGRGLAYSFAMMMSLRFGGVFIIATSTLGWRTGALPRPLVVIGYLVAAVMLFWVPYLDLLALVFPVWACLVSLVILRSGVAPRPRT